MALVDYTSVPHSWAMQCLQVYKYLGVDENNGMQHSTMRERIRREYFCSVKMVLRTELYGRYKVLVINGLALHVLTYSFGVIHLGTTEQLDRRTRKLLTCTASTILQQTWTDCMLLAMKDIRG